MLRLITVKLVNQREHSVPAEDSKSLPLLTVLRKPLRVCVSGAVHLAEVSEAGLQRKKTNPDLLPHERLPVSQRGGCPVAAAHTDQDVWVRK